MKTSKMQFNEGYSKALTSVFCGFKMKLIGTQALHFDPFVKAVCLFKNGFLDLSIIYICILNLKFCRVFIIKKK